MTQSRISQICAGLRWISRRCIWRPCGDSNPESLTPEDSKLTTKKSQSSYEKAESECATGLPTAKLPTNNLGSFDNDFYARGMHASELGIVVAAWARLPEAVRIGIL